MTRIVFGVSGASGMPLAQNVLGCLALHFWLGNTLDSLGSRKMHLPGRVRP